MTTVLTGHVDGRQAVSTAHIDGPSTRSVYRA